MIASVAKIYWIQNLVGYKKCVVIVLNGFITSVKSIVLCHTIACIYVQRGQFGTPSLWKRLGIFYKQCIVHVQKS